MELFGTAVGWPKGRSPWTGDVAASPDVPEQARTGIGWSKNTLLLSNAINYLSSNQKVILYRRLVIDTRLNGIRMVMYNALL